MEPIETLAQIDRVKRDADLQTAGKTQHDGFSHARNKATAKPTCESWACSRATPEGSRTVNNDLGAGKELCRASTSVSNHCTVEPLMGAGGFEGGRAPRLAYPSPTFSYGPSEIA